MKRLAITVLVAAALGIAPRAEAAPIVGSISFAGTANPTGGLNWATATGINFGTNQMVASMPLPSGVYAGTEGTAVTFTDFTFNPFPAGGVQPLWTFTFGGNTYSFDLTALTSITQSGSGPGGSTLVLVGSGTLSATGFTPTFGLFNLTAQGFNNLGEPLATFSFSASNTSLQTPAAVPEPASLVLLGSGMLGMVSMMRRRGWGRKEVRHGKHL